MFKARRVQGTAVPLKYSKKTQRVMKGQYSQKPAPPTEDDLIEVVGTMHSLMIAASDIAGRELSQELLDALPPQMQADLQLCRSKLREWVSGSGDLQEHLTPLLRQLQDRKRAKALDEAKFKIGDTVDVSHGRGIVRDLMVENYSDGDVSYSVDGHVYSEEQMETVTAVERLGDLADD